MVPEIEFAVLHYDIPGIWPRPYGGLPLMTGPTLAAGRSALDIRPTWLHYA